MTSPVPRKATLKTIPITQIERDLGQPRQTFDPTEMQGLRESIKAEGIRQPIQIEQTGTKKYRIITGGRRFQAAQDLGLIEIPAYVYSEPLSVSERRITQLLENSQRSELTPLEQAQALQTAWLIKNIEATGATPSLEEDLTPAQQIAQLTQHLCSQLQVPSLADHLKTGKVHVPWASVLESVGQSGMDESKRKRLIRLLDLSPEVQDLLIGVNLPVAVLNRLAQMPDAEATALLQTAHDSATDTASVVRDALPAPEKPQRDERHTKEAQHEESDVHPVAYAMADEGDDENDDDDDYDLNDGTGIKAHTVPPAYTPKEPERKSSSLQRGTPPPDRDGWTADNMALMMAALESALDACTNEQFNQPNELQMRQMRPIYRELIEVLYALGFELPEQRNEVHEVTWN